MPPQYRDSVAAEIYRDTLRAALSQPCFDGVTFWYDIYNAAHVLSKL